MRLSLWAASLLYALSTGWAQPLQFDFDALASKAKEKVQIQLAGDLLSEALKLAGTAGGDLKGLPLTGITSIAIQTFEFPAPGAYSDADLNSLRAQVDRGSGWSRILDVKEKNEHTEIYLKTQDGRIQGFLLIAAEEKELSVIHVSGAVDLSQLAQLQTLVSSSIQFDLAAASK